MRANARRTMELFFAQDAAQTSAINKHIETNKQRINDAVRVLEALMYTDEGKSLLADFKENAVATSSPSAMSASCWPKKTKPRPTGS